jgi:membrane associated rhomboid family serine protease
MNLFKEKSKHLLLFILDVSAFESIEVIMTEFTPPPKEPFFNFSEPAPAFLAGFLILAFAVFQFLPLLFSALAPLVVLRPVGFLGTSQAEQILSLLGHGILHAGWGHVLMNAGMIAVLGIATVKGARLKAISQGRQRSPSLVFMTIFLFGVIMGGLAQWLFWFVMNVPLGANAPAAVGASGGASALLATAGWAMGGKPKMFQFAIGWAVINLLVAFIGPYLGLSIAWAAHIGGFLGGMILAAPLTRANSTSLGL